MSIEPAQQPFDFLAIQGPLLAAGIVLAVDDEHVIGRGGELGLLGGIERAVDDHRQPPVKGLRQRTRAGLGHEQIARGEQLRDAEGDRGGEQRGALAGGAYHSLFVKTDGTLWTMGRNEYGQLGNGGTLELRKNGFPAATAIATMSVR